MHHFKKLSLEDQDLYEKTIQTCPLYQTYDASELIFLNLLAWLQMNVSKSCGRMELATFGV